MPVLAALIVTGAFLSVVFGVLAAAELAREEADEGYEWHTLDAMDEQDYF